MRFERAIQIGLVVIGFAGLLGYFLSAQQVAQQDQYDLAASDAKPMPCSDIPDFRDNARKLVVVGIDDALRQQIENLFIVWMKDDTGQPGRASVGTINAVRSYLHAREQFAKWEIKPCKTQ